MLVSSLRFLRGKVARQRIDLFFGVALGYLVHDGRRPFAVAEVAQLLGEVVAGLTGDVGQPAGVGAGGAVADGAGGGEVTAVVGVLCDGRLY